jgi:type IV pilus assembly protein PilO
MAKFSEMSKVAKVGLVLALIVCVTVALYFVFYKEFADQNSVNRSKLEAKKKDIQTLLPYEKNMPELLRQIESLKAQLEISQRIVPDEKEADQFMHVMQNTASGAGIEIRRYTSKPNATREFYTEVPFEMELDGPYYSVLNFFEKVGRLERIINVSNLQLASLKSGDSKAKHNYQYAPTETVVGSCTATTFFSHDLVQQPEETAKGKAKAKPTAKAKQK